MSDNPHPGTAAGAVESPFAHVEATVLPPRKPGRKQLFWTVAVAVLLIWGVVGMVVVKKYLFSPYRTLEAFPVDKYLDSYHALAGFRFKADLKVEADLGWKENVGRLMLFTTSTDTRPIAVYIPSAVGKDTYFTKGQSYIGELEVKEGGLIYANSIQKN